MIPTPLTAPPPAAEPPENLCAVVRPVVVSPAGLAASLAAAAVGASVVRIAYFAGAQAEASQSFLEVARAATEFHSGHPSIRLHVALVTRGALSTDPGVEPGRPELAAASACVRVAALEAPSIRWLALDLDPQGDAADKPTPWLTELDRFWART